MGATVRKRVVHKAVPTNLWAAPLLAVASCFADDPASPHCKTLPHVDPRLQEALNRWLEFAGLRLWTWIEVGVHN
jgi:hypothetical protein